MFFTRFFLVLGPIFTNIKVQILHSFPLPIEQQKPTFLLVSAVFSMTCQLSAQPVHDHYSLISYVDLQSAADVIKLFSTQSQQTDQ